MERTIFGTRIRELRIKSGYSMNELANKLKITKGRINMWENGNSVPKADMLIKLSRLFQVSIDYLLGNEFKKIIREPVKLEAIPKKH